jgi:hypothetical protein
MADPTSIIGLGGISGDLPQRKQGHSSKRSANSNALEPSAEANQEAAPALIREDPNAKLIEALDRLRAMNALAPVESELAATLRGAKYYQEESRTELPILSDEEADGDDLPPSGTQHLA